MRKEKKIYWILKIDKTKDIRFCKNIYRYEGIKPKSEQKMKIFIANKNEEIINKVINAISVLKYVDIIGTAKSGKDALERILQMKPDVVFLQYDFEDLSGYNIMSEIAETLQIDVPIFNIFSDIIPDNELMKLLENRYIKLNGWVFDNIDKEEMIEIVKLHKAYRDKD